MSLLGLLQSTPALHLDPCALDKQAPVRISARVSFADVERLAPVPMFERRLSSTDPFDLEEKVVTGGRVTGCSVSFGCTHRWIRFHRIVAFGERSW